MKNKLRVTAGALVASMVLAGPACAQSEGVTEPVTAVLPTVEPYRLPVNTLVVFEFVTPLNSRTSKIDEMFPIRLVQPIEVDGIVVVPAGAMGEGQVVHSAKSGWGGKAGELIVTVRYVEHNGVRIPLRRFRMGEPDIGKDRRGEAFGATMVVPLAGFLINGGEKTVAAGTRANAIVAADTDVPAPEPAAVSSSN